MAQLVGDILVKMGACTLPQIYEGLRRAAEMVAEGEYRPIGEILVDLGYITREQLEASLRQQGEESSE